MFAPRLYGYWRSSASWRVRWAFALKEVPYEYVPINILKGEHLSEEHRQRHPLGMLPILETSSHRYLSESLAMLEWLDERYPETSRLYPGCADERALVRSLCEIINSGTAPLQTPRVQKRHSPDDANARLMWAAHFTREGLRGFSELRRSALQQHPAPFCLGNSPSAADLCLVPQIYNALRFQIDVSKEFPELWKIYENARTTEACRRAAPESQPDATQE